MSTLVCHVRCLLPVSVVVMAGTLDEDSMIAGGVVLRDCLAAQPAALIVEAVHLTVVGDRPSAWLRRIGEDATRWPGVPVLICHSPAALVSALTAAQDLPVTPRAHWELPPVALSCSEARSHVAAAARSWGWEHFSRLAELFASEFVANVVEHARTPMLLTARSLAHGLEVSVRDNDPRQVGEGGSDTRGAGLELVAALATSWGCAPTGNGKVVWARIEGEEPRERLHGASTGVKSGKGSR